MAQKLDPSAVPPQVRWSPEPPPPQTSAGALIGLLVLAAAVGAGFLWLERPQPAARLDLLRPPIAPPAAAVPAARAPAEPAPEQVRAAYAEMKQLYIEGGPAALMKASVDCAKRLKVDPSGLDGCLAFDIYAADIVAQGGANPDAVAWFDDAGERALVLAQSALPEEADAARRVAQVRALVVASLATPQPTAGPAPAVAPVHRTSLAAAQRRRPAGPTVRAQVATARRPAAPPPAPFTPWRSPYPRLGATTADDPELPPH